MKEAHTAGPYGLWCSINQLCRKGLVLLAEDRLKIAVCPCNKEGCLHAALCWQEHSHQVVESDSYPLAVIWDHIWNIVSSIEVHSARKTLRESYWVRQNCHQTRPKQASLSDVKGEADGAGLIQLEEKRIVCNHWMWSMEKLELNSSWRSMSVPWKTGLHHAQIASCTELQRYPIPFSMCSSHVC